MNKKFHEVLILCLENIILFIVSLIKLLKYFVRRIYIWHILSVRNKWYISKKKNYYNPIIKATVYPWSSGWNIARFNSHYEGYKTKIQAQEAAFKMWMKERLELKNQNSLKLTYTNSVIPSKNLLSNKVTKPIQYVGTDPFERSVNHVSKNKINYFFTSPGDSLSRSRECDTVFVLEKENIHFITHVIADEEWMVTHLGDIEFRVSYNNIGWALNWLQHEVVPECQADWWCVNKNCDLDELDLETIDLDELCKECPRAFTKNVVGNAYASDKWVQVPANLEEVRQNILKQYHTVPHNGLLANKYLYRIMCGIWIYKK